ncbi:MAG TPA: endonuclease Q family protein [Candidatus Norongarragalinales archaeon]|nr:endonuclease Q family protein [Candidatus Norongarragalinales archaeon]
MGLYFADLHLHSKYSRAVSQHMDLEHLDAGARRKGLALLGTGDFSHPAWNKELREKLDESPIGSGLYCLKGASKPKVQFILQNEVATFLSTEKGVKKVHHVLLAPSLEIVAQLNDRFGKLGSLAADGRPMFGKTSPAALVEICKEISSEVEIIPAHIWTPWFGVFGSNSGFDSIKDAYEDQSRHIFALETGMSSDPLMNWRLSALDDYALISNSDAHSPHPYRIGRECNAFEFREGELNFALLVAAIKNKDKRHFKFTVEVDPNYGKYHFDGHRNCKFSCSPSESRRLGGNCPKCKKRLTIGVLSRVEELADRAEGYVPEKSIPFRSLLPLQDLIASCYKMPPVSRKVYAETERLMAKYGSEMELLLNAPAENLMGGMHEKLAKVILANRVGKLKVRAGFDGEYGVLELPEEMLIKEIPKEKRDARANGQLGLGEFT